MRNIGIIDEMTLNAVRAALDERVKRLEREVDLGNEQLDDFTRNYPSWAPQLEDAQRRLVWNIAALHETKMAQDVFAEVRDEDHPADATYANAR